MAGKPKNRLELRRQYEAAEPLDPMEDEADDAAEDTEEEEQERKPKKKVKVATKKATKAPKPAARMRVVWTVVNDAFKPVATFEYSQKDAAYARAAELTEKGKGTHFVQRVKEAMPDNAPGLGANIARTAEAAPPASKAPKASKAKVKAAKRVEDDEELEEEDDDEVEAAEDEDEDEGE